MLQIPKGQKVGRVSLRRENRSDHKAFVCSLGCAICGRLPEFHHLLRVPREMLEHSSHGKYAGSRSDDMWGIPLCPAHHRGLHDDGNEPRYLDKFDIDGPLLARSLWTASGNFELGALIIRNCWQQVSLRIAPTPSIVI